MDGTDTTVAAPLDRLLGGPARRHVVVLLALVLALDAADKATIGAVAAELQRSLDLTNVEIGVLAAASLGVAGVATIPIGLLADRVVRVRLIAVSIALWSAALVVAGAATSFGMLLLARLALGAVSASAGPTLASLVGDYFSPKERGKMYSYVLTGEIVGAGFGFVVAGEIAAVLSWRWGFWAMVLPGMALAVTLWRKLPEPARGGPSHIPEGAQEVPGIGERDGGRRAQQPDAQRTEAQDVAAGEGIEPRDELVLERDPVGMGLPDAVRYVLRVPSNRILIIASSLGWFFFAGVRVFAVIFLRAQYGLGQSEAVGLLALVGLGGLAGVLVGGRLSDGLVRRGRLNGRVIVAIAGYGLTPLLVAPAFLSTTLWVSIPLLVAGSATLGAANPPVDAGRLDVMHHSLWGRAEGVRTLARTWAEGSAPILFGWLSQVLAPGGGTGASPFASAAAARSDHAAEAVQGLRYAFLVMLAPIAIGALYALRMLRTYPRDVATAARSEERAAEAEPDAEEA